MLLIVGHVLGHDNGGRAADFGCAGDRPAPAALVEGLVLQRANVGDASDQERVAALRVAAAASPVGASLAAALSLAAADSAASLSAGPLPAGSLPAGVLHAARISIRMASTAIIELGCFRICFLHTV